MATRPHEHSDEALVRATGRPWADWRAALDAAGAGSLAHKQIAELLVREHGVSGWWAQGLTVRYEQAIGRREPGQRCTGDHEVGVSATRPGDMDAVLAAWRARYDGVTSFDGVAAEGPPRVSSTDKWRYWRLDLADGGRVSVNICAKTPDKSLLQVQHGKLADAETAERWRAFWKGEIKTLG